MSRTLDPCTPAESNEGGPEAAAAAVVGEKAEFAADLETKVREYVLM